MGFQLRKEKFAAHVVAQNLQHKLEEFRRIANTLEAVCEKCGATATITATPGRFFNFKVGGAALVKRCLG